MPRDEFFGSSRLRRQLMAALGRTTLMILSAAGIVALVGAARPASGQQAGTAEMLPLPEETVPAEGAVELEGAVDVPEGVELLARGPVHEAFAEPIATDPAPTPVISEVPPEPINEVPPEVRPEGENVVWIPGYWAWDEDGERYLWVSGIWRDVPPGRRWVPGYWTDVDGGARWVSGFWAAAEVDQVQYLDPPPESLEYGPPATTAPDNQFWVPGTWEYQDTSYAWRPGYWQDYRENWIWVPAHYTWTPAGCVFVSGYWDYRVPYRGQLFAPAYFNPVVFSRPGFIYRPRYVINTASLLLHLFVVPRYHHYYFGNYYGPRYASLFYYPFSHYHRLGYGYDPLYSYYHLHFRRRGIDYGRRLTGWHQYFTHHHHLRPPVHLHDHIHFAHKHRHHAHANQLVLARSLDEVRRDAQHRRFVSVDSSRDFHRHQIDELRRMARVRSSEERDIAGSGRGPQLNPADGRRDPTDRRAVRRGRWDLSREFARRNDGEGGPRDLNDVPGRRNNRARGNDLVTEGRDAENRGSTRDVRPRFSGQTIDPPNRSRRELTGDADTRRDNRGSNRDVRPRFPGQTIDPTPRELAGDDANQRGNRRSTRIRGPQFSGQTIEGPRPSDVRPRDLTRSGDAIDRRNVERRQGSGQGNVRGPRFSGQTLNTPANRSPIERGSSDRTNRGSRYTGPTNANPLTRPNLPTRPQGPGGSANFARPESFRSSTDLPSRNSRTRETLRVPTPRSAPDVRNFNMPDRSRSRGREISPPASRSVPRAAPRAIGPVTGGSAKFQSPRFDRPSRSGPTRSQPRAAPSPRSSFDMRSASPRASSPRMSAPSRSSRGPSMSGSGRGSSPRMSAPSRASRGPSSRGRSGGGGGGGGRGRGRGR